MSERVERRAFVRALGCVLAVSLVGVPSFAAALDSGPWDEVLRAHARRGGVDYEALKNDAAAMESLARFVSAVASMNESEPLSSWLNAYNALVVKSVVDHYPIRSVKDVDGFFDRIEHRVAGRSRTLDDIENRIIRPRFEDARVHVALNCGAVSCPPLHPRAFRQATVDRTLDRLARAWVRSARHVRVEDGTAAVNELFFWFAEDFERDAGSVRAWIARYGEDRLAGVPAGADLARIPYRWVLNDR